MTHIKKPLLDVIFNSEKRKNALLLLKDGPLEMTALIDSLRTKRTALLPQIRILKDHQLVVHQNDTYELTTIGKMIVDEMTPLLDTLETFDGNISYWGTHDLSFIPPHLLSRMKEIKKSMIKTPPVTDIYKLNDEIWQTSPLSGSHYGIVVFFHPLFPEFFDNMISNNVEVHMIVTQNVIDKFKAEQPSQFKKLLGSELFHLYVYPDHINLVGLACNDHYLFMRKLKEHGEYDTQYFLSDNSKALAWGKELFEHYLRTSVPVTDI